MASEVATAYVSLIPSFRGGALSITKQLTSAAGPASTAAGQQAGQRFTDAFGRSLKSVGGMVASAFAGAQIVNFFKGAVSAASEAQQSIGGAETVFGKFADKVVKKSKQAANEYGLSANEYRVSANLIGALFKNQGVSTDQLADKTDDMIGVAADLSAAFGGTTKQAVEALGSAFKGEFDPLEQYGISLKQSTVNAYLAAKGQGDLEGAEKKAAEQAAITAIIMEQAGGALGQFGREANTAAGQQQRMAAKWEDAKAAIGQAFLPALTAAASFIGETAIPAIQGLWEWLSSRIGPALAAAGGWAQSTLLPALKSLGSAFMDLLTAVRPVAEWIGARLVTVFLWAKSAVSGLFSFISANAGWIVPLAAGVAAAAAAFSVLRAVLTRHPLMLLVGVVVGIIAHWQQLVSWFQNASPVIQVVGAVIAAVMIPALIRLGVQALLARGKLVATWVAAQLGAIKTAVVFGAQTAVMIAKWVAHSAAAVAARISLAGTWLALQGLAIKAAAIHVAQFAKMIGQWVVMAATAVVRGAIVGAQFVLMGVRAAASAAVVVAQVAIQIARWVALGTVATIQGARIAAAWLLSLGPLGLLIAAVAAAVVWIVTHWEDLGDALNWVWVTLIKPVWDAFKNVVQTVYDNVIKPVFDAIGAAWDTVGRVIDTVWKNVIKPVFDVIESTVNTILGLFEDVGEAFSKMSDQHEKAKDAVADSDTAGAFTNIGLAPGGATGGLLRGPGTGTSDSILARLSNGEFVVNAKSTSRYLPLLRAINSGASIPGFASGGVVGGSGGVVGGTDGSTDLMKVAAGGVVVANSEDAAKQAQAAGLALMQGLAAGIAGGLPLVQAQLDRLRPMTETEFASAPTWLPDNGTALMHGLANGMVVGMVTVQRFLDSVQPTVNAAFSSSGQWLPAHGQNLVTGFLNAAVATWALVTSWLATVQPTIIATFSTSGTWLPPYGTALMRGFLSGIQEGQPAIMSHLGAQKSGIIRFHSDANQWLVPAGRDLSAGLHEGMRSSINDQGKIKGIADALITALKSEFGIKSPARAMIPIGEMIAAGVFEGILRNDPRKFLEKVFGSMPEALQKLVASGKLSFEDIAGSPEAMKLFGPAAGGGLGGGTGQLPANVAGDLSAWVRAAMAVTGVPANWFAPLIGLAMHESGGNPMAVNNWDSNAAAGIPSKGLFQTIEPTFNAYGLGGSIFDPVANAVAAIRYILARYGSIFNIASYRGGTSFVGGYETGTDFVPRTGLALIHKGEAVIPADENRRGRGTHYELHFHEQRSIPAPRQMVDALQDVNFLYGGAR